jgi:hypothetical protein
MVGFKEKDQITQAKGSRKNRFNKREMRAYVYSFPTMKFFDLIYPLAFLEW